MLTKGRRGYRGRKGTPIKFAKTKENDRREKGRRIEEGRRKRREKKGTGERSTPHRLRKLGG